MSGECITLTGMPGGFHTPHQLDRGLTLSERAARTASSSDQAAAEQAPVDAAPRPCWITPTPTGEPIPGHVIAWQHHPDTGWHAVIVTTLPAHQVHPRTP